MARTDAVSAVTGDLFEKDWSRIRGGQGLTGERRRAQMVRAAGGGRAAVFKAIRSGGCHTRAQLANQLDYLTTKSSHIVDSRGVLDGKTTLTGEEIGTVADRFARRWSDGFHPKLGQTTHMLMSFPVGTKGEDVRDIASEVCERFFANDAGHFDYLIAVHEDRAHPHAHVVLNRKSQEGEFFYLGRDHHFNYDDFRIAMVEAAETHGVRLEATRRVHRGVVEYPPRTREVYAARDEGRVPLGRERVGRDLTAVQAAIKRFGQDYRRLGEGEIADGPKAALLRAGQVLDRGGRLEPTGGVYAPKEPTAEERDARFTADLERVRARIDGAPDAERPALQKDMYALLRQQAERMPVGEWAALPDEDRGDTSQRERATGLGRRITSWVGRIATAGRAAAKDSVPAPEQPSIDRSHLLHRSPLLHRAPSDDGVYSASNIVAARTGRLRDLVTRAQIDTVLRGTGVSPDTVIARIEVGADSAALEDAWRREDIACIAAEDGLDPAAPKTADRLGARLDRIHNRLGIALATAGVLRESGAAGREVDFHRDAVSLEARCRTIRQELRDQGLDGARIADRTDDIETWAAREIAQEQRDWMEGRTDFPATPGAVLRQGVDGKASIVDPELADRIEDTVGRIMKMAHSPDDVAEATARAFLAMYTGKRGEADMPEHLAWGLGRTYATVCTIRETERTAESERRARRDAEAATRRYNVERDARAAERWQEAERREAVRTATAATAEREGYPEIVRNVAYERLGAGEQMSVPAPNRTVFRHEVEAVLGPDRIDALRDGDADAFDQVLGDRIDRCYAAKTYLQSDPASVDNQKLEDILREIVDHEWEARRLAEGIVERRGLTH